MIAKKKILFVLFVFLYAAINGRAADPDVLSVFVCDESEVKVSSRAFRDFEGENNIVKIEVYRPVNMVGEVKLTALEFQEIFKKAAEHDSSQDPLLGSGVTWLLRDNQGTWYHLYYENHEENPKFMRGRRAALDRLVNIGGNNPILLLSEKQGGYTFNSDFLDPLKVLWVTKHQSHLPRQIAPDK